MKQIIDLSLLWNNIKHALYAAMVIIIAISIPALSYMELNHTNKEVEKTEQVAKNNIKAPQAVPLIQRQS
jgi:hypothetical protein